MESEHLQHPKQVFFHPYASNSHEFLLELEPITAGRYKTVAYRGTYQGTVFFVKRYERGAAEQGRNGNRQSIDRTARFNTELQAQHILSPFVSECLGDAVCQEPGMENDQFLVYRYYERTLKDYLQWHWSELQDDTTRKSAEEKRQSYNNTCTELLWDLMCAVKSINDSNLIHCDIKPSNLLVELVPDARGTRHWNRIRGKLTDFDVSIRHGSLMPDSSSEDGRVPLDGTRSIGHTSNWSIPFPNSGIRSLNGTPKMANVLVDLSAVANIILWIFSEDAKYGREDIAHLRQELVQKEIQRYCGNPSAITADDLFARLSELNTGASEALIRFCAEIYCDTWNYLFFSSDSRPIEHYMDRFAVACGRSKPDNRPSPLVPDNDLMYQEDSGRCQYCEVLLDEDRLLCELSTGSETALSLPGLLDPHAMPSGDDTTKVVASRFYTVSEPLLVLNTAKGELSADLYCDNLNLVYAQAAGTAPFPLFGQDTISPELIEANSSMRFHFTDSFTFAQPLADTPPTKRFFQTIALRRELSLACSPIRRLPAAVVKPESAIQAIDILLILNLDGVKRPGDIHEQASCIIQSLSQIHNIHWHLLLCQTQRSPHNALVNIAKNDPQAVLKNEIDYFQTGSRAKSSSPLCRSGKRMMTILITAGGAPDLLRGAATGNYADKLTRLRLSAADFVQVFTGTERDRGLWPCLALAKKDAPCVVSPWIPNPTAHDPNAVLKSRMEAKLHEWLYGGIGR